MTAGWIVVVEPSPFRADESRVLGPFSWWRAWLIALRYCDAHPFGEARVVSSRSKVMRGDAVVWPIEAPRAGAEGSE